MHTPLTVCIRFDTLHTVTRDRPSDSIAKNDVLREQEREKMMKTGQANAVLIGWRKADIRVPVNSKCRVVLERGTCTLRDGALEGKGGAQ